MRIQGCVTPSRMREIETAHRTLVFSLPISHSGRLHVICNHETKVHVRSNRTIGSRSYSDGKMYTCFAYGTPGLCRYSIMVSISACHAEDTGSNPVTCSIYVSKLIGKLLLVNTVGLRVRVLLDVSVIISKCKVIACLARDKSRVLCAQGFIQS